MLKVVLNSSICICVLCLGLNEMNQPEIVKQSFLRVDTKYIKFNFQIIVCVGSTFKTTDFAIKCGIDRLFWIVLYSPCFTNRMHPSNTVPVTSSVVYLSDAVLYIDRFLMIVCQILSAFCLRIISSLLSISSWFLSPNWEKALALQGLRCPISACPTSKFTRKCERASGIFNLCVYSCAIHINNWHREFHKTSACKHYFLIRKYRYISWNHLRYVLVIKITHFIRS